MLEPKLKNRPENIFGLLFTSRLGFVTGKEEFPFELEQRGLTKQSPVQPFKAKKNFARKDD